MIIDNDMSIPEFSIEASSPYRFLKSSADKFVYNGPTNYLVQKGSSAVDIMSGSSVAISEIQNLHASAVAAKSKALLNTSIGDVITPMTITTHKELPYALNTYQTGYCGVVAASIMLMYYQRVVTGTYIASQYRSEAGLFNVLVNGKYLPNGGMSAYNMINGYPDVQTTGLKDYFNDYVYGTTLMPKYTSYTYSFIQSKINAARPVILETKDTHPTFNAAHAVIVHGYEYDSDAPNDGYIIVNNGYRKNGVYITCNPIYYGQVVYFG